MEILIIIALVLGLVGVYCLYKSNATQKELDYEFRNNPYFAEPNDDGKNISLFSVRLIGIFGNRFVGKFRRAMIGERNSYVTYHCTLFLFFIFPGTCYRVIPVNDTSYHIVGSERPNNREISCVTMRFYGVIALIPAITGLLTVFLLYVV